MAENEDAGLPGGSEQISSVKSAEATKLPEAIRPDYLNKSYGQLHMFISEGKAEQPQQALEAMLRVFVNEQQEVVTFQSGMFPEMTKAVKEVINDFNGVINGGEKERGNFCLREVKRSVERLLQPNSYIDPEEYKKVWGMEPRAYDLMSSQNWLKLANTYEPHAETQPSNDAAPNT